MWSLLLLSKLKGTTAISAIRADGVVAQASYLGETTKARLLQYAEQTLAPALHPGNLAVMDNLSPHHPLVLI